MVDYQRVIDWLDVWIADRSKTVILVFLVLTVVFSVGLTRVSTESGTSQFTENSPAQEAFDAVNREFTPPFAVENGSTQLIQTGRNVLSKPELVAMLEAQYRLERRADLRVSSTTSAARIVAATLDPNATTLEAQLRAVRRAPSSEVEAAVRRAATNPGFRALAEQGFQPPLRLRVGDDRHRGTRDSTGTRTAGGCRSERKRPPDADSSSVTVGRRKRR